MRADDRFRRDGFTLVELLVVIAVIGLLVGLLIPAVQYSREGARRSQCLSQLHNIGVAMERYMDSRGSRAQYPDGGAMPSITPTRPTLVKILAIYIEKNTTVFGCPSDDVYFDREGISYEYPPKTSPSVALKTRPQLTEKRSMDTIILTYDFDSCHGPEGQDGSRNYLYMDGHTDSTSS